MSTLVTILIVLGVIGSPLGIMQCAMGGPLAPVIFPIASVLSGAAMVVVGGFSILGGFFSPIWNLVRPRTEDEKEFDKIYREELRKIREQKKNNKK